jgi:hypothetical protein
MDCFVAALPQSPSYFAKKCDLGWAKTEIFLQRGLDTPVNKLPVGQISKLSRSTRGSRLRLNHAHGLVRITPYITAIIKRSPINSARRRIPTKSRLDWNRRSARYLRYLLWGLQKL